MKYLKIIGKNPLFIMETQYLDAEKFKKGMMRRALVLDGVLAATAGAVAGAASYFGLTYAKEKLTSSLRDAEKEIRELSMNVSELSGALERKLVNERKKLETHYTQGALKIYEDLGIAELAELQDFEKIIRNYEEFERHYDFTERVKTFKDRIDRKLLTIDEKIESYQPKILQGIQDSIRKTFGMPSGEKGKMYRNQIKGRLDKLVQIYDTNSNNRIAQGEVLKTLNTYLTQADISKEEKELYSFLKEQCKQEGNEENLKKFIQNYNSYTGSQEALIQLRTSLDETEKLYGAIKENKQYVTKLQNLLKDGIELKEKVRQTSAQQVELYKQQIDDEINELRNSVAHVITDLKNKGYQVETREDFANKGTFSRTIEEKFDPLVEIGSCIIGGLAALVAFRERTKTRKVRGLEKALETAVDKHNILVNGYEEIQNQIKQQEIQSSQQTDKKSEELPPNKSNDSTIEIHKNTKSIDDNEHY